MTEYYELCGANFSFDMDFESCAETGFSGHEIYNVEVEEVTEPYEAMSYWLGWDDARQDEYVASFQDWNADGSHAFDTIEDLPTWVYDRLMRDLGNRITGLGDGTLAEPLLDAYEPDTFSTWD